MFRTLYVFIIIHILRGCPEIIPRVYLNPSDTLNSTSTDDALKPLNEHGVLANIIRYWPIVVIPIAYFVRPIWLAAILVVSVIYNYKDITKRILDVKNSKFRQ
ncbi:hypothetical protein SprV_0200644300 [Sparganum proliferum]